MHTNPTALTAAAVARRVRFLRHEATSGQLPAAVAVAYHQEADHLEQLFPSAGADVSSQVPRPRARVACQGRRRRG